MKYPRAVRPVVCPFAHEMVDVELKNILDDLQCKLEFIRYLELSCVSCHQSPLAISRSSLAISRSPLAISRISLEKSLRFNTPSRDVLTPETLVTAVHVVSGQEMSW